MTDEWMMMHCVCICRETHMGFPGGSDSKESACSAGYSGSVLRLGRYPGEGNGNPLQYSSLENSMDRGAWQATYSPWGHKESDTTEHSGIHTHVHTQ